ncbi:SDR family NAD(P)-dependent oxidoreductase [Streptomyces sp. SID11385]|uniref:SDR family NAD(P)-dependent oxidoreductase n=1 Tax=Streptomyces sp. SID11385 TaxID=2706031 RepID=UPI001EF36EAE|nr:SDR family NAD(P)-dependent oxidoreductase [Streptomyces sp. SID11385]
MDRFDLTGRTALVTGAAGALGRAFALALADAGADLLLVDLPGAEGLEETAEAVRATGRTAALHPQDLARTGELPAFADRVRAAAGPVHILVNNAGVAALERFNTITPASWQHVMRVNTDAVFFLSQRFAEHMIADGAPRPLVAAATRTRGGGGRGGGGAGGRARRGECGGGEDGRGGGGSGGGGREPWRGRERVRGGGRCRDGGRCRSGRRGRRGRWEGDEGRERHRGCEGRRRRGDRGPAGGDGTDGTDGTRRRPR